MKLLGSEDLGSEESGLRGGWHELYCKRFWDSHSALVKGQEACVLLSVVTV